LTTLIAGPKQADIDICVFLEPLMEDMQKIWEYGVNVWDEYKKEHFNLKAIIFYTINDNAARLVLIGHVKGKTRCVICEDLIIKQHKLHFVTWLKDLNLPLSETEEEKTIRLLTSSSFYTKPIDSRTVGVSAKIVV
jgi:hypothetical protein